MFVPFGIYFTKDGLPDPYATVLGIALLVGSVAIGYIVGSWWALILVIPPWVTALILIALSPEEEFYEVDATGSAALWSIVFAFLASLVAGGVLTAKRTG